MGEQISRYQKDINEGLNEEEYNERIKDDLINKERKNKSESILKIIIKNLFSFFNILLLVVAFFLAYFQLWGNMAFMVVFLANFLIGLIQDIRAKITIDKMSLTQKSKVIVIRNKEKKEIYNDELVLDDIFILKGSDTVPCDAIILNGKCRVNESILTGESETINKNVNDNLLSGSYLTSGEVICRVDKVGKDNYINQIENKGKKMKELKSDLYLQLNGFFKVIAAFVLVLGLLEIANLLIHLKRDNIEVTYDVFRFNVVKPIAGAIVSLIPSGMYLLASTSLTAGVLELSQKNVLVHDMYSLDTLARVDTLCIDKTGTITDGTMKVKEFIKTNDKLVTFNDEASIFASFNNAVNDTNFTALALLDKYGKENFYPSLAFIKFDSERKFSAATLQNFGTIVIGAYGFFDCKVSEITKAKIEKLSNEGERILLVAYSKNPIKNDYDIPNDLEEAGILIIEDHIKDDAKQILNWFKNNNVDIKIISGDNYLTVQKIGKEIDLNNREKGVSLNGMKDEEISDVVEENTIFGRVSPEQKALIVKSLKDKGHKVAMFGDGVNDILALKESNVSISVANGANAAKDVSNIILLDNLFSSLPSIVEQGRRVINNLERTCSIFLIKTTFSVIVNIFFVIAGFSKNITWPFSTSNFYAWEFAAIGISSFLLALEPNSEKIDGEFIKNIVKKALPNGTIIGLSISFLYIYFYAGNVTFEGYDSVNTYATIATCIFSIFSMASLFQVCYPFNKYRSGVYIISFVCFVGIFLVSIFTSLNLLDIYKKGASVVLPAKAIYIILIVTIIDVAIIIGKFVIETIIDRKKLSHEK